MRGVWIDKGQEPDYAKLASLSITEVCFDIRDPALSRAFLQHVQGQGFAPGVYACSQGEGWPTSLSGAQFSDWVETRVRPLNVSQNIPFVHLNSETHDVTWLVSMLNRWRELRPKKRTLWGFEGMQGGLFTPPDVDLIEGLNLEYGPQSYTGSMERLESATVVLDLVTRGFSAERIHPFLDAAQLGVWWQGWAFPQGRLP